jgi:hypothetical protein
MKLRNIPFSPPEKLWFMVTYGSRLMVQGMKRQNGISKRDQGFFDPILNKG